MDLRLREYFPMSALGLKNRDSHRAEQLQTPREIVDPCEGMRDAAEEKAHLLGFPVYMAKSSNQPALVPRLPQSKDTYG